MALLAMSWLSSTSASAGTTKKKPATPATSHTSKVRKSRAAHAKPVRRSYQQAPTPERYKEIQQSLTDKGFFKGSVDGKWGPDSVEALKQFQANQNLDPDGKVGSLSLIALGLGPKRLSAQSSPQAAPQK